MAPPTGLLLSPQFLDTGTHGAEGHETRGAPANTRGLVSQLCEWGSRTTWRGFGQSWC